MKEVSVTGSRLKKLRLENDLTQKDMAAALGITQQTYSNCENGKCMSLDMLTKVCNHFHVSADYILGLDEIPKRATAVKQESEAAVMKNMMQFFMDVNGKK